MKVGIVCPYDWNVPSGVAIHVHDLGEALIASGLEVSVLAPGDPDDETPGYVTLAGRPVSVRYNGSTARVLFGPRSASRVRKWIREGEFDVLHVHSPVTPSLSMLACWSAIGPIVATFQMMSDVGAVVGPLLAGAIVAEATMDLLGLNPLPGIEMSCHVRPAPASSHHLPRSNAGRTVAMPGKSSTSATITPPITT